MLCDGIGIGFGRPHYGNFSLGCSVDIDIVEADAEPATKTDGEEDK